MLSSTWRLFGARLGVLSLALGLFASPVGAGNSKTWNEKLQKTVGHLRAGEWGEGKKWAEKGIEDLSRSLAPGKSAGAAVGMFLMCRAVAEAGLGEERDAVWDWRIAQQLDPRLETWNLAEFGSAGALLDRRRLANDPRPEVPQLSDEASDPEITPPRKLEARAPMIPEAARSLAMGAQIEIVAVVSEQGLLAYPRIVERGPLETVTLALSDAMKEWRFEPALRSGQPIAVDYKLGFKLSFGR